MAVPTGKLKKVSASPIIVPIERTKEVIVEKEIKPITVVGPRGEKGLNGRDGKDAPTIEEILKAVLGSKELQEILRKELMRLPSAMFGGAGRLDVQDLPGYRGASPGEVFGITSNGTAGFLDIGTIDVAEYTRLIDTDGTFKYVGEALPGTATSAATWRIKRAQWTSEDDWEILWADGSSGFTKVWDNRLGYSYS